MKCETNDFYGIPFSDTIRRTGYGYKVDRSTFGGLISAFDIDGHHTMVSMAEKIAKDQSFDRMCRRSLLAVERQTKYNNKKD
jgi:hypothetical protein